METKDLIIDDREKGIFRYHRSALTSPSILELERERIFDQCWVYIGHESEVEQPGDYRRRTVAGRPLFMVRGRDGQVRVFLNSCPHRGALICRRDTGNASVFQCFYHAWTFFYTGELIGVPSEDAYGPDFDKGDLGLKSPPRVDSYRGFYFVNFNPLADDLVTYLAGAKDGIDLILDQSEGGMKVIPGSNQYTAKANWKLMVENGMDGYHFVPTHLTYIDYINSFGSGDSGPTTQAGIPSVARALGNGHSQVEISAVNGRAAAHWHPSFGQAAREPIAEVRKQLVEKHGERRAGQIADTYRALLIYPNLLINDIMATTIRYINPVAADRMEVTAWHLVPREEAEILRSIRQDSFVTFLGPGGFATPDDVEAVESCQAGFGATEVGWSDISRGMLSPLPLWTEELQLRAFWRQWHGRLMGKEKVETADRMPGEKVVGSCS